MTAKIGREYEQRARGCGPRGSFQSHSLPLPARIRSSIMKVHEYQGKEILAQHGVAVQRGVVAETVEEAVAAAEQMAAEGVSLFVVKAQIHAGGRGKGGGVKLA